MSLLVRGLSMRPPVNGGNVVANAPSVFRSTKYVVTLSGKLGAQRASFHTKPSILKQNKGASGASQGSKAGGDTAQRSGKNAPIQLDQNRKDVKDPKNLSQDEVAKIAGQLSRRPENASERASSQLLAYAVNNDLVEEVRTDAKNLLSIIRSDVELSDLLTDRDTKKVNEIINKLRDGLKLRTITVNFLQALSKEEMMKQIEETLNGYINQVKDIKNEQDVHIILAKEPKPEEKEKMLREIESGIQRNSAKEQFLKTGNVKPVNFNFSYSTDPNLVGGYVAETESWIEDHSIRSIWAKKDQAIAQYMQLNNPRGRIEEVDELVIESSQPNPELQQREDALKALQELKGVVELKQDSLNKLKNEDTKHTLGLSLAEASAVGKISANIADFVNYEKLAPAKKSELQTKAKELATLVDKLYNQDKAHLEHLKNTNFFNTAAAIQPIMNDLRRMYVQQETTKNADEKTKLQKKIDETLKTVNDRCQNNLESDMLLYRYKINSWKYKLNVDLAEGTPAYKGTQRCIQDCESKIGKTTYTLPNIPQVKYSFANLKKMSVPEIMSVPTRYLIKLSYKQKEQLPLDEVRKIASAFVSPPLDIERVKKMDLTTVDPVDVDIISLDVREDLRHQYLKRNSLLHLNLTPNVDLFDKQLEVLLRGDVKRPTDEEIAAVPDKWVQVEQDLKQAVNGKDNNARSLEDKAKPLFNQYVSVQLHEDLPKEKWNEVKEVNDRILALRALDNDINQKVQSLGRQPLPYPKTY